MSDTLVFDMSTASEGAPSVFVRKDWLSILDNMNRNYQGNQCIIDTSQLANSNKYMSYREGYLFVPMVMTLTSASATGLPAASPDYVMGLKNWYGSVIHSFSLDYNGTTIVQQTPFVGMWNAFKLMTSLSFQDIKTQGAMIGFYPDDSSSWVYSAGITTVGKGVCNNVNLDSFTPVATGANGSVGNSGFLERQRYWNFDPAGINGNSAIGAANSTLITTSSVTSLWKSYIFTNTRQVQQVFIGAQIYLKHLHSFFERVPLLKGVFMKLILNLNQSSVTFATVGGAGSNTLSCTGVNSPLGGVSPIMIAAGTTSNGSSALAADTFICSLAVGQSVLNSVQTGVAGVVPAPSGGGSVQLILPSYTFNPVFETSMLSSPIKKVVYEDVYQYTINNTASNSAFTYLITNGIANVKSVLVLPFHSAAGTAPAYGTVPQYVGNSVGTVTCPPFQSPFDPAGGGPTSPYCLFTNFNVQVSGQNAIYNVERYSFEQFANQLYGQNSVNGGMTDGLTSGLVGFKDFEQEYCYYYVNVSRMLPIEEAVPKAINLIGISQSAVPIDMYVFISYGVEVSIDILSGSRV